MTSPLAVRRTSYVIWAALLFGLVAFAAVASFVGPGFRSPDAPPIPLLAELSLGFAFVALTASRIVPRLLKPAPGIPPESFALTRNVVAMALCEGAALFALVVWMLTGREWAVVAAAMGFAGVISCYPGDARWRSLLPADPSRGGTGGPSRMVR